MEFQDESRIWGAHDAYADSNMGSEDEDTLSFCDLPVNDSAGMSAELKGTSSDSNYQSSEHREDFDFNVGLFSSLSYHCTADELFQNGRLIHGTESNAHFEYGKSNSYNENSLLSNEKLQAWRTDSLESQSSYWTTSSSNISQASHRKLNHSASEKGFRQVKSSISSGRSRSTPHRTSSTASNPPPLRTKTSLKWQRFFPFGITKTPPLKLEEMRLRQQKPSDNGVEKSVLMRSVLCTNEERRTFVKKDDPRAAILHQKSNPIMENMRAGQTPRSKGWRMLAPMTSLRSCKAFISVINCGTTINRAG